MAWHIVLKVNRTSWNYFRALEDGVREGCGQLIWAPHLKREVRHWMSDQLQVRTCSNDYFAKLAIVTQSNREDVLRKLEEGIVICQAAKLGGPRLVSLDNGLDARYLIVDVSLMDALAAHLHTTPSKDRVNPLWVGSLTVTTGGATVD